MKLIGVDSPPYITVELSPTDCLALITALEVPHEHNPLAEALCAALLSGALYAFRVEQRDGPTGNYSREALYKSWGAPYGL